MYSVNFRRRKIEVYVSPEEQQNFNSNYERTLMYTLPEGVDLEGDLRTLQSQHTRAFKRVDGELHDFILVEF